MRIPEEGTHCTAGAQSSARGLRAAGTMTPWRRNDVCTVALAALAGSFGAVRALEATTCLLRLGALGARRERSELGERPRAPRRRAHSQHPPRPSLVAAAPAARLRGSSASRKAEPRQPSACRRAARCTRGTRDSLGQRPQLGPSCGRTVPGNFLSGSSAAGACVCEAVAPPASCSRLPTPPLPPACLSPSLLCACTPPLGPLALLPSLGGGPTTDQYNPLSLPPFSLPLNLGSRNESSASVVAVERNRLPHRQGLSEPGFL
ncbi:hypothetical protein NN561_000447 [Cricetulus griseus]